MHCGAESRRGQDGAGAAAGNLFAYGSESHAVGAGRTGRSENGKDPSARVWNRAAAGWRVKTRHGASKQITAWSPPERAISAQFGTQWTAADTMYALGYYVPCRQDHVDIQFLPDCKATSGFSPLRPSSVGIGGRQAAASVARAWSDTWTRRGSPIGSPFFGQCFPLGSGRWKLIAWLEKAGWRWVTQAVWWIPSPAKGFTMRCGRRN